MRTWSSGRCWRLIFSPPPCLTLQLPGWPSSFAICWAKKKLKECGRRHLIYCTVHDSKHPPKIPSGEPGRVSFAWIPVRDSFIKYFFPRCVSAISLKVVSTISPRTNELHSAFWPPLLKTYLIAMFAPGQFSGTCSILKWTEKIFISEVRGLKENKRQHESLTPKECHWKGTVRWRLRH